MPNQPNPHTCDYGFYISVPGNQFPLLTWGDTGAAVGYLATGMKCHQGLTLPAGSLNSPFSYGSTMMGEVLNFQRWWNSWGAGLTEDGRDGPQTHPYYRMTFGHTPW